MTVIAILEAFAAKRGDVVIASGPGERLLARHGVPELARAIGVAKAEGRRVVLSGGIEPPDVPRLLALGPDVLAVPEQQIAMLKSATPGKRAARKAKSGEDRIFIRDLVLPIRIGAYSSERGREQRVRFAVTADLAPGRAAPKAISDIFSYDIVIDTIQTVTAEGHVDLLETLAEDIARRLLRHRAIVRVRIVLEKLDLGPAIAGVEIVRGRKP